MTAPADLPREPTNARKIVRAAGGNPIATTAIGAASLLAVVLGVLEKCSTIAEHTATAAGSLEKVQLAQAVRPLWLIGGLVGVAVLVLVAVGAVVAVRAMREFVSGLRGELSSHHDEMRGMREDMAVALQRHEGLRAEVRQLHEQQQVEISGLRRRLDEWTGQQTTLPPRTPRPPKTPADVTPRDCYQVPEAKER